MGVPTAFTRLLLLLCCTFFSMPLIHAKRHHGSAPSMDPVSSIRHVLPKLNMENNSFTEVRVNLGDTALLPCRYPQYTHHHESQVSWIRRWDWTILSAGVYTYTTDDRFLVLHTHGSDEWTLQLKYVTPKDNGTYECQVHTGSGFLSQFVNLHVVTPRAYILEGHEVHVSSGDGFILLCVIKQAISPTVYVMWYHGDAIVNYAADRPRLSVETANDGQSTQSRLIVVNSKYSDSGNYTCMSNNAVPASIMVFVSEGDTVAAVQRRGTNSADSTMLKLKNSCLVTVLTLLFLLR